jgi:amidase
MKIVSANNVITKMSRDNKPACFIDTNESIVVETLDCFGNRFYYEKDDLDKIRGNNPATGPIFINGANAGDTLKITIEKIDLETTGVIEFRKNSGVLGDRVEDFDLKIIKMDKEYAYLNDLKLPLKPMIGVIGVAPPIGEVSTVVPDSHGGNMDCNQIKEGAILYLPVFHDGALLSLGDLHGLMGDGEIGNCGLETYGRVQLKVDVLKEVKIDNPIVIVDNNLYMICANEDLNLAIKEVNNNILDFLVKYESMPKMDAIRLLSFVGDVGICQLVNPKKTVKMAIPLDVLKNKIFK